MNSKLEDTMEILVPGVKETHTNAATTTTSNTTMYYKKEVC